MGDNKRPTIAELEAILNAKEEPNVEILPDGSICARNGPCRELATSRLKTMIENRRREIAGLEALLKIAERAENGSPLEEAIWRLTCGDFRQH